MATDEKLPEELAALVAELEAAEREAETLVAGLTEERGTARGADGSWSVAECLEHLALSNRAYLGPMRVAAGRARARGRTRRGAARPGWIGGMFVASLEPPPRWWSKLKSPRVTRPAAAPPLARAFANFVASQAEVEAFLRAGADLDLTGVRFRNPFVNGVRFSLATGLHVITAHERRHLAQAWRARRRSEPPPAAGGGSVA